jgi:hypothetical protein
VKAKVVFADARVKRAYELTRARNPTLFEWLNRAFDDIARDPYCGVFIPRRLIPKHYVRKYGTTYGSTTCQRAGGCSIPLLGTK